MTSSLLAFRAVIFYIGYYCLIAWFGFTGIVFFSYLPYGIRTRYILTWNRCSVYWLRLICGVKFKVEGKENLPEGPYIALSKHNSQWETFFLQYYLAPVTIVLKRELLRLPFFGWGLRLTDPIAIDRGNPKQALKQTQEQGVAMVKKGISVLVFPEGTRKHQDGEVKYARGGANIAVGANVPVVPIAHNAGDCWPADKFIKYPGTITVRIGKPIDSHEFDSRALTEQARDWIEAQMATLSAR